METFDRLQKITAVPIVLLVAVAVLIANGASIWLFPLILAVVAIYVFAVIGGTRLIRAAADRRKRDR
jgi:multisubunit Na+/H+ antiporter MnhG subunit